MTNETCVLYYRQLQLWEFQHSYHSDKVRWEPLAEINDIDLRLNILADDKASEILKSMSSVLDGLKTNLASLKDLNPFAALQDSADELMGTVKNLTTELGGLREVASSLGANEAFSEMALQLSDAVMQGTMLNRVLSSIQDRMSGDKSMFTPWQTELTDVSGTIIDVSDAIITIKDDVDTVDFAAWNAPLPALLGDLDKAETQLAVIQNTTKEIALNMGVMGGSGGGMGPTGSSGAGVVAGASKGIPGWLSGIRGASSLLSELPMKMMYGGMNMMMGYYGLQALANGTSGFASIQQMQQLNNSTVNQAAQYQMMLGAAGLTGTSGVSFLQGLAGNMQQTFTPVNGGLSRNAILLESLGITQQDAAQSPMMLLSTIGQRYRALIGQGRGSQASELLGLTGTTSMTSLFNNWSAISKQTSGTNLNMSTSQLNEAVKQNVNMQVSMQQLNLAFEQMAITLVPLVTRLTSALTDLMNAFHAGRGPIGDTIQGLTSAAHDLGTFATTVIAATVAMKGVSVVSDVLSGAGLIGEVGGGVTLAKLFGKGLGGLGRLLGIGGSAEAGGEAAGIGGMSGAVAAGPFAFFSAFAILWSKFGSENGPLFKALTQMNQAIKTFSDNSYATISNWTSRTWSNLQSWSSRTGANINTFINSTNANTQGWVSRQTSALLGWAQRTGASINSWSTNAMQHITSWSNTTGNRIAQWTSTHAQDISKWAQQTGQDISSWTSTHSRDIRNWAQQTGSNIATWTSVHTRDFVQWASQTGQSINSWVNQVGPDITNWANESGSSFTNWYNHTIGIITGWVHSIAGLFGVAMNNVSTSATTAANWMTQAWTNVKNFASGVFGGGSSSVPAALASSQKSFVSTVLPYAQQVSKSTGLPLQGIVSQWAYESNWGQSVAAQKDVNLAGIVPFGQYGAGADKAYAGFTNLAQFAQADISVLNASRYAGARQLAANGGNINSIYSLLSQEGYDTTNPSVYAAGVSRIAQSLANLIPHMANGGVVGSPTLAVIGEAGPEAVVPLSGGRGSRAGASVGGAASVNIGPITINVPGLGAGTAQIRELAQQVATEFVNQMKRRGNFDWS